MKKNVVLTVLFILPIVAYLFFASGVNGFIKLPVITKSIPEFYNWKTTPQKPIYLSKKITILGFTGTDVESKKGNFFNLSQKIYNRYHEFKDFQIVYIAPKGTEDQIDIIIEKLGSISNLSNWHFVFASKEDINSFYKSMKLKGKLDNDLSTPLVYIIDKERNIRGRKGIVDKEDDEYREGYNTSLVSELHNEMTDDVKILLAEYRLALKKNNAYRKNN